MVAVVVIEFSGMRCQLLRRALCNPKRSRSSTVWKYIWNRIIWPHKYLTWQSQLIIMFSLIAIVVARATYQVISHSTFSVGLLFSLYSIAVVACYIYDKDLPIGTISFDFEPNDISNQYIRLVMILLSLVFYMICVLKEVS